MQLPLAMRQVALPYGKSSRQLRGPTDFEPIRDDRQPAEAVAVEDAADRVIETVADDRERDAGAFGLGDERRERAVDHHRVQMRIDLLAARVEQRDLFGHAVVRADLAAAPGLFEVCQPGRAKRSSSESVMSSTETVPSKSQRIVQLDTQVFLIRLAQPFDGIVAAGFFRGSFARARTAALRGRAGSAMHYRAMSRARSEQRLCPPSQPGRESAAKDDRRSLSRISPAIALR